MLRPQDCKPGVLVECIELFDGNLGSKCPLSLGGVYTIFGLAWSPTRAERMVLLDEHKGRFALYMFRLLPSSRLDVFRAMLEPQEREVEHLGVVAIGVDA